LLEFTNLVAEKVVVELALAGLIHLRVQVGLKLMAKSTSKSHPQVAKEVVAVQSHMCSRGSAALAELCMGLLPVTKPWFVQVAKDIGIVVLLDIYWRERDWRGS
jgi:hypothetical protein